MDDVTYRALQEAIGKLTVQNKQLRNTNARLKRKNKRLRFTIRKLKKEQEQQQKKKNQHYRNGRKRGNYGRNG